MYKLLKWAHQTGVEQERNRIKQEVANLLSKQHTERGGFELELNRIDTHSRKAQNLKRDIEVTHLVQQALEELTHPRGYFVEDGPSIIDGKKS